MPTWASTSDDGGRHGRRDGGIGSRWDSIENPHPYDVDESVAYNITFCDVNGTRKDRPDGGLSVTETELSNTLTNGGADTKIVTAGCAIPIDIRNALRNPDKKDAINRQGLGIGNDGDPSYTITGSFVPGVALQQNTSDGASNQEVFSQPVNWDGTDVFGTITKNGADGAQRMPDKGNFGAVIVYAQSAGVCNTETSKWRTGYGGPAGEPSETGNMVIENAKVRRITPEECEVLQGFQRGYTSCMGADGPRYKAVGNSWSVPQAGWVIGRVLSIFK